MWRRGRGPAPREQRSSCPDVRRPAPPWPAAAGAVTEQCTAATDLSLRLGITRHAARTLVHAGKVLDGPMRQTGAALEEGLIDWDKARALVELLDDVPLAVCVEVEAAVLPAAGALTCPQLVRAAQRELLRVDHRDAAERHARARSRRRVSRPRVLPDGMATMTAVLPAEAAVRLDACLQAAAVSAGWGGDGRTTDQLRANAPDAMARAAWGSGSIGPTPGADGSSHGISSPEPDDADATTPFTTGGGTAVRLAQTSGRGTLISVTVGLGTLLGLDDRPGELAGYGPIGADVARMLATDGTWRRLVVDELSGTLLDVDRRRYRPPAGIVDHVRTRNRTCVFPTCSVPAASCQIDHTVPFPHGPTAAENLGPLCAQHHQLKTHGGFRLRQPAPGSFVVETPTGHLYLQGPDRQPGVPADDDVSADWDASPLRSTLPRGGTGFPGADGEPVPDGGPLDGAALDHGSPDGGALENGPRDDGAPAGKQAAANDDRPSRAATRDGVEVQPAKDAQRDDENGPEEETHPDTVNQPGEENQSGEDSRRGEDSERREGTQRAEDSQRHPEPRLGEDSQRAEGGRPSGCAETPGGGNVGRASPGTSGRRIWPPTEDPSPPF